MRVEPYVFFEGRCEEAIEFYKKAIGATVAMLMRFKDAPPGPEQCSEASAEKIMHATLNIGDSILMVSDGRASGKQAFDGFSLSLNPATTAEADKFFQGLSEGGQVIMPLSKTFWSPYFGMAKDRFGVTWMINVTGGMK